MTEVSAIAAPRPFAGHDVPVKEAMHVWTRVALLSFGGPAGQIAVMHRILVEEKRWISEERSCTHSITACFCPARKRSSWPHMWDG